MTEAQAILAAALINADCARCNAEVAGMRSYDQAEIAKGGTWVHTIQAYQDAIGWLNDPQVFINRAMESVQ